MLSEKSLGKATFREIHNQAVACQETIENAPTRLQRFQRLLPLDRYTDVLLTGCGSSYNLAQCAAFAWSEMLEKPAYAAPASELMHFASRYLSRAAKPLIIAISRTGGTTEVKRAVEALRLQYQARSLAITLEPGSDVGSVCDVEIAIPECYEDSVVMTQAFASILTAIYLLGDGATGGRYYTHIKKIPDLIEAGIQGNEEAIRDLAFDPKTDRFFFLGSGPMKGLADESALKMTEMALCASSSFHALEFRHGPIAALDKSGLVTLFASQAEGQYLKNLVGDVALTGAGVLLVSSDHPAEPVGEQRAIDICCSPDPLDELPEFLRPAALAYVGQLLGYWRSQSAHLNPDLPRHLERTVLLSS
ncbi:MAG TPA: SIS domain-containing protein [Blastocatellia bacterium]|nr:SIS domain-containing protein [Blastocatellia bacterium]